MDNISDFNINTSISIRVNPVHIEIPKLSLMINRSNAQLWTLKRHICVRTWALDLLSTSHGVLQYNFWATKHHGILIFMINSISYIVTIILILQVPWNSIFKLKLIVAFLDAQFLLIRGKCNSSIYHMSHYVHHWQKG